MVNEATFSWVRPWGELLNPRPDVPGITVTGIERISDGVGSERVRAEQLRMARRRHLDPWLAQLKVGGAYTREHADNEASRTYNRPIYDFNSVFDFAADGRSAGQHGDRSGTAEPSPLLTVPSHAVGVGVHAGGLEGRPNLTLNFGLRYEGFLNIYDASGDMVNIAFASDGGDLRTRLRSAQVVARKYYLEGGLWGGGQHTLAPRLSFAWDPTNGARCPSAAAGAVPTIACRTRSGTVSI